MITNPPTHIGILGGGQLAQMLCDAARKIGIVPDVFAENLRDPVHTSCIGKLTAGSFSDSKLLKAFVEAKTILAIESEFIDVDAVISAGGGKALTPRAEAIKALQDKLEQKKLLLAKKIPTSAFFQLPRPLENNALKLLLEKFPSGAVLKWARMGYDGKGTLIQPQGPITQSFLAQAKLFSDQAHQRGIEVYLEERIEFTRELAMVGIRSRSGSISHYPLVISQQRNGICDEVWGPATVFGVPENLESTAKEILQTIAEATDLVGAFAVEFFQSRDNHLLVNEIAPRVHNSGHYTQDACLASQFENHLRALLGEEVSTTVHAPIFAMANLIGPPEINLNDTHGEFAPRTHGPNHGNPNCKLSNHWYSKTNIRPGRKLGHINATCQDPAAAEQMLKELRQRRTAWETILKDHFRKMPNQV